MGLPVFLKLLQVVLAEYIFIIISFVFVYFLKRKLATLLKVIEIQMFELNPNEVSFVNFVSKGEPVPSAD